MSHHGGPPAPGSGSYFSVNFWGSRTMFQFEYSDQSCGVHSACLKRESNSEHSIKIPNLCTKTVMTVEFFNQYLVTRSDHLINSPSDQVTVQTTALMNEFLQVLRVISENPDGTHTALTQHSDSAFRILVYNRAKRSHDA